MGFLNYRGIDSDADYNYTDGRKNTGQKHCWKAGERATSLFLRFPYAYPEPVLAKMLVSIYKWLKKTVAFSVPYGSQTSAVFRLCSYVGENRTVATIDNYTDVTAGSELQLEAALRIAPVAVGIDGASPAVQVEKTPVLFLCVFVGVL